MFGECPYHSMGQHCKPIYDRYKTTTVWFEQYLSGSWKSDGHVTLDSNNVLTTTPGQLNRATHGIDLRGLVDWQVYILTICRGDSKQD